MDLEQRDIGCHMMQPIDKICSTALSTSSLIAMLGLAEASHFLSLRQYWVNIGDSWFSACLVLREMDAAFLLLLTVVSLICLY